MYRTIISTAGINPLTKRKQYRVDECYFVDWILFKEIHKFGKNSYGLVTAKHYKRGHCRKALGI